MRYTIKNKVEEGYVINNFGVDEKVGKQAVDKFPRTERSFEEECLKLIEKIKKNGTSLVVYNEELGVIGIGKVKVDNEYKGTKVRTIKIEETN